MRNIDVRIQIKLEVKVSIEIIFRPTPNPLFPHPKNWLTQKFTSPQKNLTQVENFDPRKKIDPRNPRKNYDPRKKYFDPRNPRNPRYHATHAI